LVSLWGQAQNVKNSDLLWYRFGGKRMALFLGQGMVAWMRACSWVPSTATDNSRPLKNAAAPLPNDLRGEIVLVLAAMALDHAPEIRP
jgi:hypothetical protein